MRMRTAFPLFQAIGDCAGAQLRLRKWLREKRERRTHGKWERELERAIRKNGMCALLEPRCTELSQTSRYRTD